MKKTLDHYLRLGAKIKDADNRYLGEDWQLPTWLRAVHDVTHMALKNARDISLNIELTGEQKVNSTIQNEFIYSQIAHLRELSLPDGLRADIQSYLAYITEIRRSKETGHPAHSDTGGYAVHNPNLFLASADTTPITDFDTQAALTLYRKVTYRIEKYLHANLPYWKYDERLSDYGFNPAYVTGDNRAEAASHILPMD